MRSIVQLLLKAFIYKGLWLCTHKKITEQYRAKCTKEGKMLERDIVKKILDYINKPRMGKSWKGYAWKNHGGLYSVKGLPDVMAVVRKDGKSFFLCLEVKQPGNKPTEIQKALIRKFQELGVTAGVVTSIDEVVKIIEELK